MRKKYLFGSHKKVMPIIRQSSKPVVKIGHAFRREMDAATQTEDIPGFTPLHDLAPTPAPASPVKMEVASLILFDESSPDSAPEKNPEHANREEANPAYAAVDAAMLESEKKEEVIKEVEVEKSGEDMERTVAERGEGDNHDNIDRAAANGNEVENKAMSLTPHTLPDGDLVIFEVSCVICFEPSSSLSGVGCSFGHLVCSGCMDQYQGESCPAKIYMDDGVTEGICQLQLEIIDEAVKRTSLSKYFEEEAMYECGAKGVGCKVTLPGKEIGHHEMDECRYRSLRYCGFQKDGCTSSFNSLDEHILHLLKKHDIPLAFREAHFLMRYDREEYVNHDYATLTPIIRGIIETRRKSVMIALVAEDLEDDKGRFTRMRLVNIFPLAEPVRMIAKLMACVDFDREEFDPSVDLEHVEFDLAVLPSLQETVGMDEFEVYNGKPAFLDLSDEDLARFSVEKEGKKFFHLLIKPQFCMELVDDVEDDGMSDGHWEEESSGYGEELGEEGQVGAVKVFERRGQVGDSVPALVPATSQREEEVQPEQEVRINYDVMDDDELEAFILQMEERLAELAPVRSPNLDRNERKEKRQAIRKVLKDIEEVKKLRGGSLFAW